MPIFDIFSKRQKQAKQAGQPDVYQYDTLPQEFRVQVIHIWIGAIGYFREFNTFDYVSGRSGDLISNECWVSIHDAMAREKGVFTLGDRGRNPFAQCQQYLMAANVDDAIDIIEFSFKWIELGLGELNDYQRRQAGITQDPDDAIRELNHRFQEHGIGYQFTGGNIIRVDSQYIHAAAVRPAIALLHEKGFTGASDEFLRAHEHYRNSRYKEAIVEALKAFESTMKTICDLRKWPYDSGAAAKALINVLLTNELIPASLSNHFSGLRAVMEAGLPTVRNKTSGHGQGATPVDVPEYLAAYALHLAAANIVFLVEAHKAKT